MKNKFEVIRNIIAICSFLMVVAVIILFIIFQDRYEFLISINYILLLVSGIGLVWGYFYSRITPIWVGIVLTLLHLLLVISLLFLAKWINIPRNDLLGLPLSAVVGLLIYLLKDKIVNFLLLFMKQISTDKVTDMKTNNILFYIRIACYIAFAASIVSSYLFNADEPFLILFNVFGLILTTYILVESIITKNYNIVKITVIVGSYLFLFTRIFELWHISY